MANLTMDKDGMKFVIAWTSLGKTNQSTSEKRIIQHVQEPNFMDMEQGQTTWIQTMCFAEASLEATDRTWHCGGWLTDFQGRNGVQYVQEPNFKSMERSQTIWIQCVLQTFYFRASCRLPRNRAASLESAEGTAAELQWLLIKCLNVWLSITVY